jgi:phosphonate dehydrogenase
MFDGIARIVGNDGGEPWCKDLLGSHCRQAAGIMAFMPDHIDSAFMDRCPELKVVGAALKGFDNIDVAAATERGIWVTICADLLTIPTAELTIGLMLALGRKVVSGDRQIRAEGFRGWRPRNYGTGLDGSTVGIVGFGNVGQAIAERLLAFRCRINAHDSSGKGVPPHLSGRVATMDFGSVLATSDFIILALPLLPSTLHIIDAHALSLVKPGALLVNPARGSLVDEAAVADAIAQGRLGGYAADVFACEDWARSDRPPVIDPRLLAEAAPTVFTPHIGSAVVEVRRKIEADAAHSIIQVLKGQAPAGAINQPRRATSRVSHRTNVPSHA